MARKEKKRKIRLAPHAQWAPTRNVVQNKLKLTNLKLNCEKGAEKNGRINQIKKRASDKNNSRLSFKIALQNLQLQKKRFREKPRDHLLRKAPLRFSVSVNQDKSACATGRFILVTIPPFPSEEEEERILGEMVSVNCNM